MAIKKAADFELGMAKVKAISGATTEEFEDLTEEAERLGLVTAQTMTDIATGMEAFARAGFDAHEIVAAMGGAVALAESQVMDLGTAVQITAAILNGMRLPASESERVVNALAAAASTSATTVESLGESMKYLAPAAADLNVPLEEVLAVIGKLGDAGLRGGLATRAFSTALNSMASPTEEAIKVMEELDIAFFDAHGEFIGIIETVGVLERALEGMTTEQKKAALGAMFTGAAVRTFSILLGVGSEELANYQEELVGTTTAFDQQAEMLNTLKGQWQILKGSIELLLVTIGTDMMPILKSFVQDRLIPIINNMTKWIEKMGGLKGIFAFLKGKVRDWAREHESLISALKKAKDAVVWVFNAVKSFVNFLLDHGTATVNIIAGIGAAFIAWKLVKIATGLWGVVHALTGPIGLVVALTAAGIALGLFLKEKGPAIAEGLGTIRDVIYEVTGGFIDLGVASSEAYRRMAEDAEALDDALENLTPNMTAAFMAAGDVDEELLRLKGKVLVDGVVKGIEESESDIEEAGERTGRMYPASVVIGFRKAVGKVLEAQQRLEADWAASREEHHEDEIEEERTFWGDFLDIVKDSAADVGDVMGDLWKSLKSMAKSALGDTFNSIVDHFRDSRRLAEEHSGRMLDIEADYSRDTADLQGSRQTEFTDAETTHHRTVEDIETRYRRELQEITGDDTEARAQIETRYRDDMEDALTTYARRREDIETDYTSEVLRQEKRREQALADEKEEYRDMQKSIFEVLGDIVRDLLTALREELFVKAAAHAVEALAWSFIPPLFFMNPSAIGHASAAAALFAGGAGLAIAGFEKGGVFERPTLISQALVGEGGKEAFLPLSPSVFGEIGKGIVNALTVPTPTPVLAGGSGTTINMDWRGLYEGATINVRDDQDPARIARANFDLFRSRLRSKGVDVP